MLAGNTATAAAVANRSISDREARRMQQHDSTSPTRIRAAAAAAVGHDGAGAADFIANFEDAVRRPRIETSAAVSTSGFRCSSGAEADMGSTSTASR